MVPERYEQKFKGFIKLLDQARNQGAQTVIIQQPEVLGDTYDELVESLNRLAQAGLTLTLVPPSERMNPKEAFRWS